MEYWDEFGVPLSSLFQIGKFDSFLDVEGVWRRRRWGCAVSAAPIGGWGRGFFRLRREVALYVGRFKF